MNIGQGNRAAAKAALALEGTARLKARPDMKQNLTASDSAKNTSPAPGLAHPNPGFEAIALACASRPNRWEDSYQGAPSGAPFRSVPCCAFRRCPMRASTMRDADRCRTDSEPTNRDILPSCLLIAHALDCRGCKRSDSRTFAHLQERQGFLEKPFCQTGAFRPSSSPARKAKPPFTSWTARSMANV